MSTHSGGIGTVLYRLACQQVSENRGKKSSQYLWGQAQRTDGIKIQITNFYDTSFGRKILSVSYLRPYQI
jgi:hypothetical protein